MMDHDSIKKETNQESNNICNEIKHVEATVSEIFSSQFSEVLCFFLFYNPDKPNVNLLVFMR